MDDKWSEGFPEDVLDQILNLGSLRDSIRAGSVCKSWHRVSKLNTSRRHQLPWLMPCNPNSKSAEEAGEENRCLYSLSDDTIYNDIKIPQIRGKSCCGSFIDSDGWLMSVDYNREVRLFHPWRRIELKLPRLSSVYEISPEPTRIIRSKAAISDDAAVVAVMNSSGNFAFCRTREDTIWTSISVTRSISFTRYEDIIYHKGQFYAVSSNGTIVVLSITRNPPYVEILIEGVDFMSRKRRKRKAAVIRGKTYLAPASEGILIIRRFAQVGGRNNWNHCSTYDFQVYELGIEETTGAYKKTLVEVENLGDRVMFLGLNSSMIVMASQFPGLKGNCIYFTHDWGLRSESADMGIFNMEDRTFLPVSPNGAHPSFSLSIWIRPLTWWNSVSPNQISSSGGSCPCLPGVENWKLRVSN